MMSVFTSLIAWVRPNTTVLGNDAAVGRIRFALVGVLHVLVLAGVIVWAADIGQHKKRLVLATGPRGGESHNLAVALSRTIAATHRNFEIDVVSTEGSARNMRLLASGDADLAIIHANVQEHAAARLVVDLYYDFVHFVVSQSSGISKIGDLVGKRIAVPPPGSGDFEMFQLLLDYYRINEDQLTALPMSRQAARLAMSRGAIDAIFALVAPGNRALFELIENEAADVIGVDLAQGVVLREPELEIRQLKEGTYGNGAAVPQRDLPTIAVYRMLVANAAVPPEVISLVTSTLFEHRRSMMEMEPLAASVRVPSLHQGTLIPLHQGARSYFERDAPSFFQEYAEVIALCVTAFVASFSAIFSVLGRRKRKRIDRYNRELIMMSSSIPSKQTKDELHKIKSRLQGLVADIVRDTEHGYITNEAFEFFAFTWRATEAAIRDREAQLESVSHGVHPTAGGDDAHNK